MEWVYVPDKNFIGHGFLAVDFFFCLSGFVIGYAYDDRIAKMGVLEFFKSRIIRLHPLVVAGSVFGLLAFLFDPFGGLKKVCLFLGKISYPLYMTHYAVLWMFGNYYASHKPGTMQLALIIIAALILLVGIAYLIMVIYDIPIRKYLNDKRTVRLVKQKAGDV